MKVTIDTEMRTLHSWDSNGKEIFLQLYSKEAFELLSHIWLKQEWNLLHWQSFSWMGFQVWQLPDDLLRLQEVIVALRPDVIVETGVNRGGSSIFFASLCRLLGKGQVVSIDITIPAAIRESIEQSPFADLITLIEGDSVAPETIEHVRRIAGKDNKVFVFLDSDHTKAHVLRELNAYSGLVSPGSYIVAADGVMQSLAETPWGQPEWIKDNPAAAAKEFVAEHPEFVIQRPHALFGEEHVVEALTYWPDAWIYRLTD